jgi:hypothetical protein
MNRDREQTGVDRNGEERKGEERSGKERIGLVFKFKIKEIL